VSDLIALWGQDGREDEGVPSHCECELCQKSSTEGRLDTVVTAATAYLGEGTRAIDHSDHSESTGKSSEVTAGDVQ
jgi:hypothetical protein